MKSIPTWSNLVVDPATEKDWIIGSVPADITKPYIVSFLTMPLKAPKTETKFTVSATIGGVAYSQIGKITVGTVPSFKAVPQEIVILFNDVAQTVKLTAQDGFGPFTYACKLMDGEAEKDLPTGITMLDAETVNIIVPTEAKAEYLLKAVAVDSNTRKIEKTFHVSFKVLDMDDIKSPIRVDYLAPGATTPDEYTFNVKYNAIAPITVACTWKNSEAVPIDLMKCTNEPANSQIIINLDPRNEKYIDLINDYLITVKVTDSKKGAITKTFTLKVGD